MQRDAMERKGFGKHMNLQIYDRHQSQTYQKWQRTIPARHHATSELSRAQAHEMISGRDYVGEYQPRNLGTQRVDFYYFESRTLCCSNASSTDTEPMAYQQCFHIDLEKKSSVGV